MLREPNPLRNRLDLGARRHQPGAACAAAWPHGDAARSRSSLSRRMTAQVEAQQALWLHQMTQQGLLDAQFDQLLTLDGPDFLREIVGLYFEDAARKMAQLDQCWTQQPVDFKAVDRTVHQLKGASASFGACQVAAICVQLRQVCQQQDASTGMQLTKQAKVAIATLQQHVAAFMALQQP